MKKNTKIFWILAVVQFCVAVIMARHYYITESDFVFKFLPVSLSIFGLLYMEWSILRIVEALFAKTSAEGTNAPDFNKEAQRAGTFGLAGGMIVFTGLGLFLIVGAIARLLHKSKELNLFVWFVITIFCLFIGLCFLITGLVCLHHFRLKLKLKQKLEDHLDKA